MKTKRVKVFSFSELSEDAKQTAIDNFSDVNVSYEWWEPTYEDAKRIGLKITSFDLDRDRHAEGHFLLSANEVAANIMQEHGETCETYKTAENFMEEWQPLFNDYMNEESITYEDDNDLMVCEDEFLKSLLEDYSILLQNESEYLQSDEAIIETIEANEYEFLENGNLFNL
jgi:hypothetical protein